MKNAAIKKATERDSSPEIDFSSPRYRRIPKPKRGERLTLGALRVAAGKTQTQVAAELGWEQAQVSRLEGRSDALLSTLRKYAEALGATCEVAFVYPTGHRVVIADPEE